LKQFQKGFQQAVIGIISGILQFAILDAFVKDKLIPSDMVYLFTFVGFLGTIATIKSYQTAGFIYNLGWIGGSAKDKISLLSLS
jgi:hypothetical protein